MRKKLQETKEKIPNHLGKAINNPTLRWVFQILEGIGVLYVEGGIVGESSKKYITNFTPLRKRLLEFLGRVLWKYTL